MSNTNYIILLPPSEGKIEGGDKEYLSVKNNNSNSHLDKHRDYLYHSLISYINTASIDELKKLFSVSKDSIVLQARELLQNHNKENTLLAIQRYTGVMFKYLNYESLEQSSKQNAEDAILFIDALFGLLKVSDFIPNYKLSIGAKFPISNQTFSISKYWRAILKAHFEEIFLNKIILDILPLSHREAISQEIITAHSDYYKVNFYEMKNGIPKNSGHNSKQLKGEFIRYILGFNSISLDILQSFHHSKGYRYSSELSDKNSIVFLKA